MSQQFGQQLVNTLCLRYMWYMLFHPFKCRAHSVKEPLKVQIDTAWIDSLNQSCESKDAAACNRWLAARLLVIDEV